MFDSAVERAGLTLTIDCPPLRRAGLRRPRDVGEDRHEPALQRVEVHVRGRRHGARCEPIDGAARADGHRHRHRHRAGRPGAPVRALPPGRRAPARAPTRAPGIGLALVAELAALHGGSVGGRQHARARAPRFTVPRAVRRPSTCRPSSVRRAEAPTATERTWPRGSWPRRCAGSTPRRGGRRRRRRRRPRRGCSSSTTTPTCATTSPRCSPADYRSSTAARRRGRARARAARDPPDLVADRRDDAQPRRLRAAARRCTPTRRRRDVPVIMVSARAGEEGTIEGLEAGADDYLVKPFAARELLARVHANLELDRARRTRDALRRSGDLLDQAQRLAGVGSWELDLATGAIDRLRRVPAPARHDAGGAARARARAAMPTRVHPDDLERVRAAIDRGRDDGRAARLRVPRRHARRRDARVYRALGEVERDEDGAPVRLRGSKPGHHRAAGAPSRRSPRPAAEREAAARERRIADELQRSLLPAAHVRRRAARRRRLLPRRRRGHAGRRRLVRRDRARRRPHGAGAGRRDGPRRARRRGHGPAAGGRARLRAARAAARRRARVPRRRRVSHLGDDQIVTCLYAVYDPRERIAHVRQRRAPAAAAGARRRAGRGGWTASAGPPLGAGPLDLAEEQRRSCPSGALLALYTDGLVERRDRVIDVGIDRLADALARVGADSGICPASLVGRAGPRRQRRRHRAAVARMLEPEAQATAVLELEPDTKLRCGGFARS